MSTSVARYDVRAIEAERERRALKQAQARYERAVAEAQRLAAAVERAHRALGVLGVAAPSVSHVHRGTSAAYESAAKATEAATVHARRAYEDAVVAARARSMTAAATTTKRYALADNAEQERNRRIENRAQARVREAAAAATEAAAATAAPPQEDRRNEVERIAGRLPADASTEHVHRAEMAAADAVSATTGAAFGRAIHRLRSAVEDARDEDNRRRANEAVIARLRADLDGLDGGPVAAAVRQLEELDARQPLPAGLDREVAAVVASARAEADRDYALEAVGETLAELGYDVDAGFTTAVAEGGAVVDLPRRDRHGLQVRERGGHLLFNVVRYGDGTPGDHAEDGAAEASWCASHDELTARARERGVDLTIERADPPGHQPIQYLEPRFTPATTTAVQAEEERRRRERERQRAATRKRPR